MQKSSNFSSPKKSGSGMSNILNNSGLQGPGGNQGNGNSGNPSSTISTANRAKHDLRFQI